MEFRSQTLPNGLQVLAEISPEALTCAVGFFVRAGARDESPALSGVSHFLEHMVFKGNATLSADDVNRRFDEMGAVNNAHTTEEGTAYFAFVLPEYLPETVKLWSEVLRPALRVEDFTTEKEVILEEIRMYADEPPYGADDRLKELFFGPHPLSKSVLGTAESVSALTAEQMRTYFQQRYSADHLVLVATGKVDFAQLVDCAAQACGDWPSFPTPRAMTPLQGQQGFEVQEQASAAQEYILQFAAAPGAQDQDRWAAELLARIIGHHTGSRLYWELVDTGRAETASVHHFDYQDCGVFHIFLCCEPELAAENLQTVHDILRQVETEGVTQTELDQARNKVKARLVLASERPRDRLFLVAENWTQRGEYRTVKEELSRYDAVTLSDVQRVLARFPLSRNATVAVGPLTELPAPR